MSDGRMSSSPLPAVLQDCLSRYALRLHSRAAMSSTMVIKSRKSVGQTNVVVDTRRIMMKNQHARDGSGRKSCYNQGDNSCVLDEHLRYAHRSPLTVVQRLLRVRSQHKKARQDMRRYGHGPGEEV